MNICDLLTRDQESPVALVVFTDRCAVWWLRGLRSGFRHCFLLMRERDRWILADSLAHRLCLRILDHQEAAGLLVTLTRGGDRIVPVRPVAAPLRRKRPLRPFSCVELSARSLGMDARLTLTPFQLFIKCTRKKGLSLTVFRFLGMRKEQKYNKGFHAPFRTYRPTRTEEHN